MEESKPFRWQHDGNWNSEENADMLKKHVANWCLIKFTHGVKNSMRLNNNNNNTSRMGLCDNWTYLKYKG